DFANFARQDVGGRLVWLRTGNCSNAVLIETFELGLRDRPDHEIWREALRHGSVVLSRDADFANFARQDVGGRLVWLRTGNCSNAVLIETFE
ncbi:hypothetical protein CP989_24950, partial [Enterobacter hormaechei]|uniref:DUF5615 family PIN-like protein n=1 Tax=Enterobacter hormaechei TaxID=158836 RepID=UPI000BD31154